ncbi:hypothetical protein M422DRAFT_35548 [Sphaerobolus stellatus SS14]|uniref:Uncharacterized protein n=1 Tax=Sphaerobolus stellatus (strain SS14) TaxID=990650 RepID=A0A0C9V731_SPHS4|nr:hypothetical protein M422DRAFT_35548 [Sphaerobolus stellatus SS14]
MPEIGKLFNKSPAKGPSKKQNESINKIDSGNPPPYTPTVLNVASTAASSPAAGRSRSSGATSNSAAIDHLLMK